MDSIEYHWARHPSLCPVSRKRFLISIMGITLFVGGIFALSGAWPILLFSVLQAALVQIAFRRIALHDNDYELLIVNGVDVSLEICCAGQVQRFRWNLPWVQVICGVNNHGDCELALRSCGQVVRVGRLICDEQRRAWSHELRRQFRTAA